MEQSFLEEMNQQFVNILEESREPYGSKFSFEDLFIWKQSHQIVLEIYKLTRNYPSDEKYGVTSQIRRAAASVAANIAEGSLRSSRKEFLRFLKISRGSLGEVKYFLILSNDLKYCGPEKYKELANQTDQFGRILNATISKISNKINP